LKYFISNKKLDFDRGYSEDAIFANNQIQIRPDAPKAYFFSRVFDGLLIDNTWHRFKVEGFNTNSTAVQFTFYATNDPYVIIDEDKRLIQEYLRDGSVSIINKKKNLEQYKQKHVSGEDDCLLFDVTGRYLFYLCEMYARENEMPSITNTMIYFPKQTWLELLPAVYSMDPKTASFTERFLSIYQSIYNDLDMDIRNSDHLLDPMFASRSLLEEIAGWFGFRFLYMWPEDRLRLLVKNAARIAAISGTVEGLLEIIEMFTGERPVITECFKVAKVGTPEEKHIYGTDTNEFVLTINEKYVSSEKQYNSLMCIISQCKPAHMTVRIRPIINSDTTANNAYLGINTSLGMRKGE